MFEQRENRPEQKELWIVAGELPAATPDAFYRRVNQTLEKIGFAAEVWRICAPAYADASRGGRPGIDPVVYLKMLMVGFFENLPSERAIASRCADSLSVRGFLGYSLTGGFACPSTAPLYRRGLRRCRRSCVVRVVRSYGWRWTRMEMGRATPCSVPRPRT